MTLFVVHGGLRIQKSGLHGIADGGVRNGLLLDATTLTGDQNHGITDVIGTNHPPLNLDQCQGCRSADTECADCLIGLFDAVEDRFTQAAVAVWRRGDVVSQATNRENGGLITGR